ncbi:MAG: glycosyltransferase [Solirubrobacterales bacterium]|nr:glycosyltransferase [Solirubrobacterales bacterium]MBV9918922.1 glycosyltransferase [Solirubrobacterales bacterium]
MSQVQRLPSPDVTEADAVMRPAPSRPELSHEPGLALAHDYLLVLRGAERTFAAMADLWPAAPIFTLLYDAAGTQYRFADRRIHTSPLQHLRVRQRNFRSLLPVFPPAARRLALDGHDCILSSSSAFVHALRKPPGASHICYCHSPFRYAWHEEARALSEAPTVLRPALSLLLRRHRAFDRRAIADVDRFIANSQITRARIREFWGRDAVVVHPPVEIERFHIELPEDYVLFVGELVRHKRPELAIEAAAAARRPIKIVGTGPELVRLQRRYAGKAEFLGRVGDEELASLYARAAALVVPGVEEFGIAAVEAQAAGRPVIAADAGGVRETILPGRTGLLVGAPLREELARALRRDLAGFDSSEIRRHASRFSKAHFQTRIAELVADARRRR